MNVMNTRRAGARDFTELIEGDRVAIGSLHDLVDPTVVEVVARAGVDFVAFEFEHGLRDERALAECIRAADAAGVPALVRVGRREQHSMERFLDAGAAGLIVAHITDRQRAEEVVGWCKYPPEGGRGSFFSRGWAARAAGDEYDRKMNANARIAIFGIIEDPEGVENIEEILDVPGLTGVFPGPGDLGLSLGIRAWQGSDEVKELIDRVRAAARAHPRAVLMSLGWDVGEVPELIAQGTKVIILKHDTQVMGEAYEGMINVIRSQI